MELTFAATQLQRQNAKLAHWRTGNCDHPSDVVSMQTNALQLLFIKVSFFPLAFLLYCSPLAYYSKQLLSSVEYK